MNELYYSWEFDDSKNRGGVWYSIAFAVMSGFVLWGFLTAQYGFSFIIMIVSGVILFIDNNLTDRVRVEISKLGIKIGEQFYEYSKLESFGIIFIGETPEYLRLNIKKSGVSKLNIAIRGTDSDKIKEILLNHLPEDSDAKLSMSEKIIKNLKL